MEFDDAIVVVLAACETVNYGLIDVTVVVCRRRSLATSASLASVTSSSLKQRAIDASLSVIDETKPTRISTKVTLLRIVSPRRAIRYSAFLSSIAFKRRGRGEEEGREEAVWISRHETPPTFFVTVIFFPAGSRRENTRTVFLTLTRLFGKCMQVRSRSVPATPCTRDYIRSFRLSARVSGGI